MAPCKVQDNNPILNLAAYGSLQPGTIKASKQAKV